MKLVPFKAIYPNLSLIASHDSFFGTVKSQYPEYSNNGFFKTSDHKAIYIYQLISNEGIHKGVLTCTDISDYFENKILKHENTIAAKEQKMMNLMLQNKAMVKPVLLAYDRVEAIDDFIDEAIDNDTCFSEVKFESTGDVHKIWEIRDQSLIDKLVSNFAKEVPHCYIADGHHRIKTCQLLNETNTLNEVMDTRLKSIFSVYFSWNQLSIYDYSRCIDAFQDVSPTRFMAELSKVCNIKYIKSAKKPNRKHQMTMLLFDEWYKVTWKKSILEKHKNRTVLFDTYLLNKYVLESIIGIVDIRGDQRIKYIDGVVGTAGLTDLVNSKENRVGFCLYPITADNVKAIAEAGQTLPPKSTWFEPRVKNGLLVKGF